MTKQLAQFKQRQSLAERQKQHEQKKLLISHALTNGVVDASRKRKFEYSDEEEENELEQQHEVEHIVVQPPLTKASANRRVIFTNSDDEGEATANRDTNAFAQPTPLQAHGKQQYKKMRRFDPDKHDEDDECLKTAATGDVDIAAAMAEEAAELAEAQKEQRANIYYHKLSEALPSLLAEEPAGGFSLLSLFDRAKADVDASSSSTAGQRLTQPSKQDTNNLFRFDSPERELEAEAEEPENDDDIIAQLKQRSNAGVDQQQQQQKRKKNIFVEPFFIAKNAAILKEGRPFFQRPSQSNTELDEYEQTRGRLALLISTKIKKSQKHKLRQKK